MSFDLMVRRYILNKNKKNLKHKPVNKIIDVF